jgi:alpha-galactosidase
LNGDFYRLKNPSDDRCYAYYITNADKTEILVAYLQNNAEDKPKLQKLKIATARANITYKNTLTNELISGAELRKGISVMMDTEERYGKDFHFVAIDN